MDVVEIGSDGEERHYQQEAHCTHHLQQNRGSRYRFSDKLHVRNNLSYTLETLAGLVL